MEKTKMSLKLLVDTTTNKVLFAEAGKDFVDFLFHIMSLPVGSIVKLIGQKNMVGGLGELYKSIESFSSNYMQENVSKDSVLNPKSSVSVPLLLLNDTPTPVIQPTLYKCPRSSNHNHYGYTTKTIQVTDDPCRVCSSCGIGSLMNENVAYLASNATKPSSTAKGYVKEVMTYMVMDNLEVKPSSTISAISLLNKYHVKNVGALVEKEVQVGLNEGVAILKASLETKTVLSTVFL